MRVRVLREKGLRLRRGLLRDLGLFLQGVLGEMKVRKKGKVAVILSSPRRMHELNSRFLGRDWPANVLSFCIDDQWEIYVNGGLDEDEVARWALHGLLHALGKGHYTPEEAERNIRLEEELYASWKLVHGK